MSLPDNFYQFELFASETVIALTKEWLESGNGVLPILADALEEAGLNNRFLLSKLRRKELGYYCRKELEDLVIDAELRTATWLHIFDKFDRKRYEVDYVEYLIKGKDEIFAIGELKTKKTFRMSYDWTDFNGKFETFDSVWDALHGCGHLNELDKEYGQDDRELRNMIHELWGPIDGDLF